MELKEEVLGMLDVYDESEEPETEGFVAGGSSESSSYKEVCSLITFDNILFHIF